MKILEHALKHPLPYIRFRAQIVLLSLDGKDAQTIAGKVGVTERTVHKWQDAWEREGYDIFPEDVRSIPQTPQLNEQLPTIPDILPHLTDVIAELPPVELHDAMWEAGRKIFLTNLVHMLEQEPIAIAGEDLEGVHQMRVAIRRMRSVFDFFGEYFDKHRYDGITKGLRRTGKRLGAVRDLDVFLEKTRMYITKHLDGNPEPLHQMLALIEDKRDNARERMLDWLDSKQYERFIQDLYELVKKPDTRGRKKYRKQSGEPLAFQVGHIVPRLIYGRMEAIWAYEPFLADASPEMLHSLRIEFKRLRYLLEFFTDLLGEDSKPVIKVTRKMQNYLGDFNDAAVSLEFMKSLLAQLPEDERDGITIYMDYRRKEYKKLYKGFDHVWQKFNRAKVKQALGNAVTQVVVRNSVD